MSDMAYIGPSEDPDNTSHLPVSGEYSPRVTRRDQTLSDMDDRHEHAALEDDFVSSDESQTLA